jgi:Arc/MetJ family transcription regulator
MLRTNVYINKTVVENALKLSSVKTKKAIINIALEEYVENHKPKRSFAKICYGTWWFL